MRTPRRRPAAGFTLVELMIVVAIIGILASVAMPAFSRYVKKSRTAEAVGQLNRLWLGSVTYYEADHFQQTATGSVALPRQFPGPASEPLAGGGPDCCGNPGDKCPGGDTGFEGAVWQALDFGIPDPYSYKPNYTSAGIGAAATFEAQTIGNQDCDGDRATYFRRGGISSASGDVTGDTAPQSINPLE